MPIVPLLSIMMCAPGAEVSDSPDSVILTGAHYRLVLGRDSGYVEPQVLVAGQFASLVREGGEQGWYGYNDAAGEKRTSQHRAEIEVSQAGEDPVVEVRCPVDPTAGAEHEALYVPQDDFVAVRSQLRFETPPEGLSIPRVAPRWDLDTKRLTHFAFRAEDGSLNQGSVAALGPPDVYVGVAAWGERGCRARDFDPQRPYLAFYNPQTRATFAVIYPFHDRLWRGRRMFLQVYHGGCNYVYSGLGDPDPADREFVFCFYADDTGGIERLEQRLPDILAAVERLVDTKVLPVETILAEKAARARLAELRPQVTAALRTAAEQLSAASPDDAPELARKLWLARWLWREAEKHLHAGESSGAASLGEEAHRMATAPR